MSVHPLSWVLKHSDAKLGDRLVLIVLADHASDDGTDTYPSVATIAVEARLSERQVQRCLKNLIAAEEIEDDGRSRYGTRRFKMTAYRRSLGHIVAPAQGDIRSAEGVTSTAETTAQMSPEPSLEQPSELQPSEDLLAAAPPYDPLKGRKVNGQDLPWNALAAATLAGSQIDGSRMARALRSIRADIHEWAVTQFGAISYDREVDVAEYERGVARMIEGVARALREDAPTLTWGPEGVARNFRRGMELVIEEKGADAVDRIVADVRRSAA